MNGSKKKAGKSARAGKRRAYWCKVHHKSGIFLKSPAGEYYAGTAADVRRLALSPIHRNSLAGSLRIVRTILSTPDKFEERRENAARARRDAILYDTAWKECRERERNDLIVAAAAARLLGETLEEFRRAALLGAIEAAFDVYHEAHGEYGLPFTRQERAALTCKVSDYCLALRVAAPLARLCAGEHESASA